MKNIGILLFLFVLTGCSYSLKTVGYQALYAHLKAPVPKSAVLYSPYYLMVLVDARRLDYTDAGSLLKTLVKHPSDGSKNGDTGHAWILLHGFKNGCCFMIEGGHSGELGRCQPRYFDGIMNAVEKGIEPNPIKYLWETQHDGFFQNGSGGHSPTFAIKINLTEQQFSAILDFIDPKHYPYAHYSLISSQCTAFAAQAARIAGLELSCETTIRIPESVQAGCETIPLWKDPAYSALTVSTPDTLERSMRKAVEEGLAENALLFYKKKWKRKKCLRCCALGIYETLARFPCRYQRARLFND